MASGSGGLYAGARLFLGGTRWRRQLDVGVPVFVSDGARVAARVAAGVELALFTRIGLALSLGVERYLNPQPGILAASVLTEVGLRAQIW